MKLKTNFIIGTTPIIKLKIEEELIYDKFDKLLVRLVQNDVVLDVIPTYFNKTIEFQLSQEQSLMFEVGDIELQIVLLITTSSNEEIVYKSPIYIIESLDSLWKDSIQNE